MLIDFHTHIFPDKNASVVIPMLEKKAGSIAYSDGTAGQLRKIMEQSNIDYSIILPVATAEKQVIKFNDVACQINEKTDETGLISFGCMHPLFDNYKSEMQRMKDNGLLGLKIHPDYQDTFFNDISYKRIIYRANELDMIVVTHAGMDIGYLDNIHCYPDMIVEMLDELKPQKLVLAHMGGWCMWDEVEEKIAGRNVFFDTSFSIGSIPYFNQYIGNRERKKLMSLEQFERIVKKHGADKILFATDNPWGSQKDIFSAIEKTKLTIEEKEKIYYRNSAQLLGLEVSK